MGRMTRARIVSCVGSSGGAMGDRGANEARGSGQSPMPGVSFDPTLGSAASTLLNAISEGVCLSGRTGTLLWGNEFYRRLGGAMHERLAGLCRQYDRAHPVPPPSTRTPVPQVHEITSMASEDRWFEADVAPVDAEVDAALTAAGAPTDDYLLVVLRDVTAARRLRQKIDAIELAGIELQRFDAEVVRKYNAHERLKLLESRIVRVARDLLHFDHFAIRLLDERSGKLELVIGAGLPPEYDSFEIRPALEGQGITGYVAASGRSYVCTDTQTEEMYLPGVQGARSSLTMPLRLQEKVIGVINVESLTPSAFGEEERQLGEIFARYIAMAVHLLDLLVVERSTTNQNVSGRVAGELDEPLQDIAHELDMLLARGGADAETARHVERIRRDVDDIRRRVKDCAAGPTTLLGVEKALAERVTEPALVGKRVLVADDEPKIRRIIGDVLRSRGCAEVLVFENGAQAIEAIEKGGARPFDLVISDIRMPDRNGYEVFACARKSLPGVPVILMTGFGYDPHHSIVRASEEGLQSVLFKPFQVERLIDEVKRAFTKA